MLTDYGQNSLGSVDAVGSHLRGLARIMEIQDRNGASRSVGLLQRVILMYVNKPAHTDHTYTRCLVLR